MNHSGGVFDLEGQQTRLQEIEYQLSRPGVWDNPESLTPVLKEKSVLEERVAKFSELKKLHEDVLEWLDFAEHDPAQDILEALKDNLSAFSRMQEQIELEAFMRGPDDKNAAILEIHPGAGGTEAQDWAEMLLRMYLRWAENNSYKTRYLDYIQGDGAGIKSVTLQITGDYAFGQLKGERGIHRLIRISPFDTSGRRHTSFASVDVYPQVSDDINIEINEEDLRIDVFKASGPGGQHVNKTSSAIRITHAPSGLVVQCQTERSQRRNKESAMKILKAKLYDIEMEKIEEERQEQYAAKDAIAWGSQIRTYTLQPYRLVKDHRTNAEVGDVDSVLDGNLNSLIHSYLLSNHE
ncbi:MAG: peptide chain release factor 2 [Desulfonatronovibrio sp. MSAO_Bac4]|nr:MAG: peptide chain release factor 2 [Desulfonatronovibrio sp. MSAO_Bac4]